MRQRLRIILPALALVALGSWQVWASLSDHGIRLSVAGGGGGESESSPPGLQLKGTVGEPAAGKVEGGELLLYGGFWGTKGVSHAVSTEGVPSLRSAHLHPPVPNPFNPRTTLSFELPSNSRVRVEVYDVSGRRIRTLVDRVVPSGRHEVVWNGRADNGGGVASGTYFARLSVDGEVRTQKMTLLK